MNDVVDRLLGPRRQAPPPPIAREPPFDPEGSGYDYESARRAGLGPDESGHWPSRDPTTGLILKGTQHPTYAKTLEAEIQAHPAEKSSTTSPISPTPSGSS